MGGWVFFKWIYRLQYDSIRCLFLLIFKTIVENEFLISVHFLYKKINFLKEILTFKFNNSSDVLEY